MDKSPPPSLPPDRSPEQLIARLVRLPSPTTSFRVRAWREFQRALDPLAPPRPLRLPRR